MSAAHPLAQAASAQSERPDTLRHRLIPVFIGDEALTVECSVTGRHRPAVTQADPEFCHPAESPEIEIVRLWLSEPWRDLSGLLADEDIEADLLDQCDAYLDANAYDDGRADDAYDRWRDAQMEARS